MKGKFAVVGTLALVLAAAGPAAAQEAHRDITLEPGKVLMEVKVPNQRLYDRLYSSYDFVEAVQRNGDGSLSTDVLVNPEERRCCRPRASSSCRTLETDAATERREDERDAAEAREALAQNLAETGSASSGSRSQSAIPLPGEVTIQRAYTFTNYAGRFLYVEAHTKAATPVTPNGVEGSPVMALSFAGADGVFGAASNMPIFRDNMTGINNNNVYMYHRHLVRVTNVEPKHVRVASSAGGVDEAPVSEWVGTTRPPHAAGLPDRVLLQLHGPDGDHRPVHLARGASSRTSPRSSTCRTSRTATAARRRPSWACRSARRTRARSATSTPPRRSRPSSSSRWPTATRAATTSSRRSTTRASANAPLTRDHDRQRPHGQPGHDADRRADEHGGAGRRGDQRQRGRERAR